MHVEPITLEGQHIRLEPLSHAHHAGLCRVSAAGDLWKLDVTLIPGPEEMTAWIDCELSAVQQGCDLPFTIFWLATDEIVGCTRYCHIEPDHRKLEIRTWIAHKWQRTIINTESKLLLLQHAFETLGCIRVEFITDILNAKSLRALIRIGAKIEGTLRNHLIMRGGRYRDSYILSIIDTEWPAVKNRIMKLLKENPWNPSTVEAALIEAEQPRE